MPKELTREMIRASSKKAVKRMNEHLEELKISNPQFYLDVMRLRNATLFEKKK
tara:strand:+ start:4699 stop:4857 length:159 start_codon:yes stop_codon:yes gene_type:complete